MLVDDLALTQTLRARGADVVGVQNLEHVRAGIAHERAHADHDEHDDRQHQMVRLVEELSPRVELVVVSPDETIEVKPAELDREDQLQQRRKEERRQGDAGQRDDRDRVVRLGILLRRRDDAERDCDDELEHEAHSAHHKAQPHGLVELIHDRDGPLPAVAEVAAQHRAQPSEEAGDDVLVQVVSARQLRHPLLEALGTRLHGLLPRHVLNVARGETTHQSVDDERHKEQNHDAQKHALEDILPHFSITPLVRKLVGLPDLFSFSEFITQ